MLLQHPQHPPPTSQPLRAARKGNGEGDWTLLLINHLLMTN